MAEAVDHYKSWGGLKKQLQSFLCEPLKGKITYFYTNYHEAKNTSMFGRAAICHDGKELVSFSWDVFYDVQWKDEYPLPLTEEEIREYGNVCEAQKAMHEKLMREKWMPNGTLCHEDFIHAAVLFLKTDVSSALRSDNYLLRVLAYLDRRVGKRTLLKIKDEVEALPEWAAQFYRLRCRAEGLED